MRAHDQTKSNRPPLRNCWTGVPRPATNVPFRTDLGHATTTANLKRERVALDAETAKMRQRCEALKAQMEQHVQERPKQTKAGTRNRLAISLAHLHVLRAHVGGCIYAPWCIVRPMGVHRTRR